MDVELGARAETLGEVGSGGGPGHYHQLLGARKRQRLEDDGVDDVEHAGHGADGEPERHDGRDEEPGGTEEPAPSVAEVGGPVGQHALSPAGDVGWTSPTEKTLAGFQRTKRQR